MELVLRFDYGRVVPWVRRATTAGSPRSPGPTRSHLIPGRPTRGRDLTTVAEFELEAGDEVPFVLTWHPSHEPSPRPSTASPRREDTTRVVGGVDRRARTSTGAHRDLVQRSLITLKALTYAPTGGIVAAPTTSLPEPIGGVRNWDYRFCWLRDATLTLQALMHAGYMDEARAWRDWLLRAVAGSPDGAADHVRARRASGGSPSSSSTGCRATRARRPVRIGNAASDQFQLDVYGELMDALLQAREGGLRVRATAAWRLQLALLDFLEGAWDAARRGDLGGARPAAPLRALQGHGLGRVRPRGADGRALRRRTGPSTAGASCATRIHREVCERGFDAERGTFTQSYGSRGLDAATLMIPLVGFLPPDDERVVGTVEAIQRELVPRRLRAALRHRRRPTTACRRARARSCPARSGSPTASR